MKVNEKLKKLENIMLQRGVIASRDLIGELGISRATLLRLLAQKPSQWVSIGKTHNQKYGWLRSIADLGQEVPLFRIDETGKLLPIGRLQFLEKNLYLVEPGGQIFNALPPEIHDMSPQGFMGRNFAGKYHSELGLPPRLQDWSDEHLLKSTAKRGEDFPGNLIVGEESAKRWQNLIYTNTTEDDWIGMMEQALKMESGGSSAGGDRPKFTTIMPDIHFMVKFAGPAGQPDQKRWADLLYCENIVYSILQNAGIACVKTTISSNKFVFLGSERFDRVGLKGRKPYLSFAAVDAFLFGGQQTWSHTAEKLSKSNRLSKEDFDKVCLVEAFAQLIGDTDRHFYNMGLLPEFDAPASLIPSFFRLAPIFDKSPMVFAPYDGRIIEREFEPGVPKANLVHVWDQAITLAKLFWETVTENKSISSTFRKLASECLKKL